MISGGGFITLLERGFICRNPMIGIGKAWHLAKNIPPEGESKVCLGRKAERSHSRSVIL